MKKGIIYISTILALLLCFISCERDDICTDVPITPLLVIVFRDNDPSLAINQSVPQLQVTLLEDGRPFFEQPPTTDSIRIPLNTLRPSTVFQFTRNTDDVNQNNTATDTLNFTYEPTNVFVNSACGFKTTFSNLDVSINEETGNNNWIQRVEVLNTNVNDEPNTHLHLFF